MLNLTYHGHKAAYENSMDISGTQSIIIFVC